MVTNLLPKDRFRTLFDSFDQGIAICQVLYDAHGQATDLRYVETNPAFESLSGLKNAAGRTTRELNPVLEPVWVEMADRVAQTGEPVRFEWYAEGLDRWLDIHFSRMGSPSAHTIAVVFTNITQRKQGEQTRHQSEEQFRAFIRASSDVVYSMSADWSEMRFLVGKDFIADTENPSLSWLEKYIHPDDQPAVLRVIQDAIRTKSLFELEHRVVRADGTVGWTHSRAIPLLNAQANIDAWFGTACDISERKGSEEALRETEERFRTLLQNLPDYAIFRLDAGGFITEWTEGAQRIKGYSAEEAIGQHLALFYTPEGLAAGEVDTELAQSTQTGRAEREGVRIRKGGERFWVNEICTAIRDATGRLTGFTKISRDITVRKQTEQSLRDVQKRLQIVLDSIADHAIITTNTDSIITGWNPGAQQLFGWTDDEAIGQSTAIIFTPEDQAAGEPRKEMETARQQGKAADERYHLHKDGTRFYVSGVQSPLFNAEGQLLGYVKVARDLSERQRMEQTLLEADRRKDEFLAMLAHELRNPLAPIRNVLQILNLTAEGDEMVRQSVALMSRQVDHLVRLVDDLLDVSRISQGKIELRRQRLDLTDLVRQTIDALRSLYAERQRHLQVSLPAYPVYIDGDETRLAQVVTNLLTNGVRYTHEGGQVWVELEPVAGGQAVLRVRDNGIGLAADQLSAIFELFVQVDNSPARAQGGLGLGLTLVRQLVDLHGGRVEARSAGLGLGSEFVVHLPLLEEAQPVLMNPSEPAASKAPGHRILVVDDNPDAALTLAMLLKLKGHQVHTRHSGLEGLEAAQSLKPDVVLLDIGMPQMDGYETARQLRQQPEGGTILLIALTGYGQDEDKRRTREAGFNDHLVKPVDLAHLTQLLDSQLSG